MGNVIGNWRRFSAAALVVALGSFIGVQLGRMVIQPNHNSNLLSLERGVRAEYPDDIKLSVDIGDTLPELRLVTELNPGEFFSPYISNKKILLIFLNRECSECSEFLEKWRREIVPILRPDVAQFLLFPVEEMAEPDAFKRVFHSPILYYDKTYLVEAIHLVSFPAVVSLTEERQVFDVQYGNNAYYHREMIEEFTTAGY